MDKERVTGVYDYLVTKGLVHQKEWLFLKYNMWWPLKNNDKNKNSYYYNNSFLLQ